MPVARQLVPERAWFKSSYSGGNATECLEAAFVPVGVLIRDSKRPEGPHVTVTAEAWDRFVTASMKSGG
ncbi:DUF397 domain-containing protein [Streptomyces sp. NBC_00481]|uniref:DUF397 domain-containing protein n=1 Tax=unclassified Streptomyces TaxID=2593676 RepID=UPI002DDC7FAF|nr:MULTISPECIES: DUF397 domain-containing protein [unclassified Streptomyces]WRY98204.1 DUF397 domain-containing protein [Streptomyces sp. NBC_00481]